jgi:hypothetical protein
MFNLNDILASAQGGALIGNLAQQFGITPEQAQAVVKGAIPQLSAAMRQPGALGTVVEGMLKGDHQQAFQDATAAQAPASVQQGGSALDTVFGNSALVNEIAAKIAARAGVSPDLVAKMLPVIASVVLGGLYHAMQNQGLGNILGQIGASLGQGPAGTPTSGAPGAGGAAAGGGLGGLIGGILSSVLGKASAPSTGAAPSQAGVSEGLQTLEKILQPGIQLAVQHQAEIEDMLGKIVAARR